MRNRRNVIIAFLLVAVLCLGVGYAAITDTLNITANVDLNTANDGPLNEEFDTDVYFVNPAVKADATTNTLAEGDVTLALSTDKDTLTITVSEAVFTKVTDTLVVTVDVKNDSTVQDANIAIGTENNALFTLTAVGANNKTVVTKDGGVLTFTLTLTLDQLPVATTDTSEQVITLDLTASPVVNQ